MVSVSEPVDIPKIQLFRALWRTRSYILPELKHLIYFVLLTVFVALLGAASGLLAADLLMNKVFLGSALTEFQASFLGADAEEFVDVESLSDAARYEMRTVFLFLFIVVGGLSMIIGSLLGYYQTWILQRVNQHLRLAMIDNAVHLSLRYHNRHEVGDSIYRVYQDSAMVTSVIENGLVEPLTTLFSLVLAYSILSLFDPYLGSLFLLCGLPSILVGYFVTPILRRQSFASRQANSALTSLIQENVAGVEIDQVVQPRECHTRSILSAIAASAGSRI